jgi:hypothetical protein
VNVVKATELFSILSGRALEDPRTRLLVADGRTHLWHSADRYDVIVSQPTNPWIAGVGDLFTREHFLRARERLAENGIFGQWLQGYSTTPEVFATILRTFRDVFPDAQLWRFAQGEDFLLVGRREPGELQVSLDAVREEVGRSAKLRSSLADAGVEDERTLLWYFSMDKDALAKFAGEGARNTDDSGWLEYRAPLTLFSHSWPLDGDAARELEHGARWPFPDAKPHELERLRKARDLYYDACRARRDGPGHLARAEKLLVDALGFAPVAPALIHSLRAHVIAQRMRLREIEKPDDLRRALDEMARAHVTVPDVLSVYAQAAWRVGRSDESERAYRRLLELRPTWQEGRVLMARLLMRRHAYRKALDVLAPLTTDDAPLLAGSVERAPGEAAAPRDDELLFADRSSLVIRVL